MNIKLFVAKAYLVNDKDSIACLAIKANSICAALIDASIWAKHLLDIVKIEVEELPSGQQLD